HLSVDECDGIENPRFLELGVQIVAFARALANAAEYGAAAVALLHVVDEFLNDYSLADACTAEQSDLSALHERGDEIDDLDACLEDFGLGFEIRKVRRCTMDGPANRVSRNGRTVVDRLTDDVEDAAECRCADRNCDRRSGIDCIHAALDAIRRGHGNGADLIASDVLLYFDSDLDRNAGLRRSLDAECVVQLWQMLGLELHVQDGADDLDDLAYVGFGFDCCGHMGSGYDLKRGGTYNKHNIMMRRDDVVVVVGATHASPLPRPRRRSTTAATTVNRDRDDGRPAATTGDGREMMRHS